MTLKLTPLQNRLRSSQNAGQYYQQLDGDVEMYWLINMEDEGIHEWAHMDRIK